MADSPFAATIGLFPRAPAAPTPMTPEQAIGLQRQGVGLQADQFALAEKQLHATNQIFAGLLQDPSDENLARSAVSLRNMGVPEQTITNELMSWAQKSPQQRVQDAIQHLSRNAAAMDAMRVKLGTDASADTGGEVLYGKRDFQSGAFTPAGGTVQKRLTPAEESEIGSMPDPDNPTRSITGTKRQRLNAVGDESATSGGFVPRGVAPAAPPRRPPIVGPNAGFTNDLAAYNKDKDLAKDTAVALQPLIQAVPLIEKLGTKGSGPGSAEWNTAKNALIRLGVPFSTDETKAYDEANKYLRQYLQNSPLAGRSDLGLQSTKEGSPNLETMGNAATLELTKNVIAQGRRNVARALAFPGGENSAEGYSRHAAEFQQNQHVDAYRFDLMSDTEKATALREARERLKSGNPTQKAEALKFINGLETATKHIYSVK